MAEGLDPVISIDLPGLRHEEDQTPMVDLRSANQDPNHIDYDKADKSTGHRGLKTAGAVVLAAITAGVAPALAAGANVRAKAASSPVTSKLTGLFTPLNPADVVSEARASLLPDRSIAIRELTLTPATLGALGDCATGSIKALIDTPEVIQQEMCDGSPAVMTPQPSPDQTRFQPNLNSLGTSVAKSIPGLRINPETTSTLMATGNSLQVNYACASSTSTVPRLSSIELSADGKAAPTFCASDKIITMSSVDVKNPKFASAFAKYNADSIRNTPWGGDRHNRSLFVLAPATPKQQNPRTSFKYSPAKGSVSAGYDAGATTPYMDKVGTYSEETSVQIRRPGSRSFKQVGRSVLNINGLREILGYGYGAFSNANDSRVHITVPEVGQICKPGARGTKMRLKIVEAFKADPNQDFQHGANGKSDFMKSSQASYTTSAKVVCK
jgi:hypothetical protein